MSRIHSVVVTGLFLTVTTTTLAATHNWPQWEGPTRNCWTDETGLLKSWPEGGPKQKWIFRNAGTGYSGPAVVDGVLYTLGTRDGKSCVLAIDANTGNERWAAPLGAEYENDWGNGPRCTPTVENGLVYVLDPTGILACIRAKDGSEVWRTSLIDDLGGKLPNWGYCESVLIDGDLLLCTPGGDQGAIAALEKATGKVRWRATEMKDNAHYSSIVKAAIHGQPQYVQLMETRLVGLAPEDGRLLWESPFLGRVAVIPTPIVHENKVFATAGYGAGCTLVDVSGENIATVAYDDAARKLMKNHHGGVIRIGDYLYGHSEGVGWLCMEFATGKKVWAEKGALGKGAIGYADGMFYCLGEDDGEVVLIDATPDGWNEQGRFTPEPVSEIRKDKGKRWTHPVIVDGKLFLRDQDLIYCYDVKAK